ncbi:hypothetical protein JZ751_010955 [Albula glossodonta]|uniref:Uncharacterized protein n=1 Tax=Albula glossodonta TaxID=121402 RepID=A0A8T2NXP8_9TELE|nr:hypothetical protein JZ751_010955 [Albula glossodonta]
MKWTSSEWSLGWVLWLQCAEIHNLPSAPPYILPQQGCGEHLVRTVLARECSMAVQSEDAHQALLETMQNKFISKNHYFALHPTPAPAPVLCFWNHSCCI